MTLDIQVVGVGTRVAVTAAPVLVDFPAGVQPGDLIVIHASVATVGVAPQTPVGWKALAWDTRLAWMGRIYVSGDAPPTINFPGVGAGATCVGQTLALRGTSRDLDRIVEGWVPQANAAAQNIAYPALSGVRSGCRPMLIVWKNDNATSYSTPAGWTQPQFFWTTIGSDSSGAVLMGPAGTDVAAGTLTVVGGAAETSIAIALSLAPRETTWFEVDSSDPPCEFVEVFAAGAAAAGAAMSALRAGIDALLNPAVVSVVSAAVNCADGVIPYESVELDPDGLADLSSDPYGVEIGRGLWVSGHAVAVPYSGTVGNQFAAGAESDFATNQSARDNDAVRYPPVGGAAVCAAQFESLVVPRRVSTTIYWQGAGVPALGGAPVTSARLYLLRLSD